MVVSRWEGALDTQRMHAVLDNNVEPTEEELLAATDDHPMPVFAEQGA